MFLTKISYGTALQLRAMICVRKVCNFSGSCFTEHKDEWNEDQQERLT